MTLAFMVKCKDRDSWRCGSLRVLVVRLVEHGEPSLPSVWSSAACWPCRLPKCLPAARSSPHCQAGACVKGTWETNWCFRVESEPLMYSFLYVQFLFQRVFKQVSFQLQYDTFLVYPAPYACYSCSSLLSDGALTANTLLSSLGVLFSSWYLEIPPELEQCLLLAGELLPRACSRTPTKLSTRQAQPCPGSLQTDRQHSHEHEKYVFTALFGCAPVREDQMEVRMKPCSDNPWLINSECIIETIYKSYI